MNTDTDVRASLKDIFGNVLGTEGLVMPQNAAGVWLVEPKALDPMWSETCLMNYPRLFLETVLDVSLMTSVTLHGVMKPIIINGTKTCRVRKFEIVDGYHRLIAAGMLCRKIPVCLIDMSAKGKKPSKRLVKDFLEAVYSKEDAKAGDIEGLTVACAECQRTTTSSEPIIRRQVEDNQESINDWKQRRQERVRPVVQRFLAEREDRRAA